VPGDGADAFARLKRDLRADQNLCVLGSNTHSLISAG
jgi:hypothetical protein